MVCRRLVRLACISVTLHVCSLPLTNEGGTSADWGLNFSLGIGERVSFGEFAVAGMDIDSYVEGLESYPGRPQTLGIRNCCFSIKSNCCHCRYKAAFGDGLNRSLLAYNHHTT